MGKMTVSEVSRATGVSVRTLHYYDEIGLLKPAEVSQSGYRYYDEESMSTLQQILFYRELGFSLSQISEIFSDPNYDNEDALRKHRSLLVLKRQRYDDMIRIVDETLSGTAVERKIIKREDIEKMKKEYADEVKARWGKTKEYEEAAHKEEQRTPDEAKSEEAAANEIFAEFARIRETSPESAEAFALVKRWQDHITNYHYACTNEILSCLGEMYIGDERFTENLDRFGKGTAKFMSDAIRAYCAKA